VGLRRIAQAGLIGWRARVGEKAAHWLAQRTPLDERDLRHLVGGYLFVSRARRMAQMLMRLRRGA
jgi:hypothetical protein